MSLFRPVLMASFRKVFAYGGLSNLLALAPSLYMLEVYGRVVTSRSGLTLLMMTGLIIAVYAWMEVIDWVRESWLQTLANKLELQLSPRIWKMTLQAQLSGPAPVQASMADVQQVRSFLTSPAALALVDLPFAVVVILIIFAIHIWLGVASVVAAALLGVVAYITHQRVHQPMDHAQVAAQASQMLATSMLRQSESVLAMGMQNHAQGHWQERQDAFLNLQAQASQGAGWGSAMSRFIQVLQASLLLGLGCWLTLLGLIPANGGMMVVASILGAKALSPITQLIMHSRTIHEAWASWRRLDSFLGPAKKETTPMPMPAPKGLLTGANLSLRTPDGQAELLTGVQFRIEPGQLLAVLGPSGAGKTSLSRMLVGVWPPATGKVRLDGVDIQAWDRAEIGPHIGYLPQNVELFEGTLALNIARFQQPEQNLLDEVITATGLQGWVSGLTLGLNTPLGVDGHVLSGGMRQRVGLARALYGWPRLVVLDEPNAHLDELGEAQLTQSLAIAKARNCTVVLITHRTAVLSLADQLMVLREGQMQACGPRDEVIAALQKAMQQPRPTAGVTP